MLTLKARTIEAKSHLQTKKLFWLLFVGSRGSNTRIRIMSVLRKRPSNRNQLATELGIEYKNIQHHIKILSGILIWIGLITRIAAAYQLIVLIGAQLMFGFDFTMGPAIWKDPALIGITIMLLLYGSGKFGLDYRISKSKDEVQAT